MDVDSVVVLNLSQILCAFDIGNVLKIKVYGIKDQCFSKAIFC